jgi:tetratricopeptide (TPR) repeat protein
MMRLIYPLLAFIFSCQSTKKEEFKDFDIGFAKGSLNEQSGLRGGNVSDSAKIDWKAFFKKPPSQNERQMLEVNLDRWKSANDAGKLLERGRAQLALGRMAEAEISFREVLRFDNKNVHAALELAQIFLQRQDSERAFEFLGFVRTSLESVSSRDEAILFRYRFVLALTYIDQGDRLRGEAILRDL